MREAETPAAVSCWSLAATATKLQLPTTTTTSNCYCRCCFCSSACLSASVSSELLSLGLPLIGGASAVILLRFARRLLRCCCCGWRGGCRDVSAAAVVVAPKLIFRLPVSAKKKKYQGTVCFFLQKDSDHRQCCPFLSLPVCHPNRFTRWVLYEYLKRSCIS